MSLTLEMYKTNQELLDKLKKAASIPLTKEEIEEQRISWAYSCTEGMTKDEVRRILSRT